MTPNSPALLTLLLIALVGAIVLAVLRWRHFHFRRTSRFLILLLIQFLAVGSTVVIVNRSGEYFTTWAQVAGSESGIVPKVAAEHPGRLVRPRPSTPDSWRRTPAERRNDIAEASRSRLEIITITGHSTGYSMRAMVYLPGSYSASGRRRFPVLQLQSGYPGSAHSWIGALDLQHNLDTSIADGSLPAVVAVMPSQNPVRSHDSECVNADPAVHPGSLADTYLAVDVPDYLRSHYRVGLTRRDLVIGGYSTGGYCAANLALRHPETFGGAIVLSGYFRTAIDHTTGPLFRDEAEADANDPFLTVRRPHPPLAFFLAAAQDNADDLQQVKAMEPRFPSTDRLRVVYTATGGHSTVSWKVTSRLGFAWIASVFGG